MSQHKATYAHHGILLQHVVATYVRHNYHGILVNLHDIVIMYTGVTNSLNFVM